MDSIHDSPRYEEAMKEINDSFSMLDKKKAKKALERIARDFTKMTTPAQFISLTNYLNKLPSEERRFVIMHLLTGTMTLYAKGLGEELERENTRGIYL
jgi:hypothetical protein